MNGSAPSGTFGLPYLGAYPSSYVYEGVFPPGFAWGLGTAAYQIEGGWNEDGRGPSIWDSYSGAGGTDPDPQMAARGPIVGAGAHDHSGAVACDHYHRFRADVQLMKSLGIKHYRFSVAWPRLLPNGTLEGGINEAGLHFYDELIDALLAAGIQPFLTLYHWDLPSALQTDTLPGWLDRSIVRRFEDFATVCFHRWGRKVSRWATFNEPWTFVVLGYGTGSKAPGGRWAEMSANPYTAGHNVLLAHAAAVRAFRQYTAASFPPHEGARGGVDDPWGAVRPQIGITNNMDWREPLTSTEADVAAAERAREWWLGWFCDPIWHGDYPRSMREALGDRLPVFTDEEKAALVGSADFLGLNHYGSSFVVDAPNPPGYGTRDPSTFGWESGSPPSYWTDFRARSILSDEMRAAKAASEWLYSVPWGLRKLLSWVKRRYGNVPILVTENGWSTRGDETAEEGIADGARVLFLANYTSELRRAIYEDGVDVRGYYAWSLMDNFEWERGYTERFGLVYTNFETLERHPKASARWFAAVSARNALVDPMPFAGAAEGVGAGACTREAGEAWAQGAIFMTVVSVACGAVLFLWLSGCAMSRYCRQPMLHSASGITGMIAVGGLRPAGAHGGADEAGRRGPAGGRLSGIPFWPRTTWRRQRDLLWGDEDGQMDQRQRGRAAMGASGEEDEEERVARVVEAAVREAEMELRSHR